MQFYGGVSHCIIAPVEGPAGTPPLVTVALMGSTDVRPGDEVHVDWSDRDEVELTR